MPEERIDVSGLDDEQKAHLARAVEEYDVARGDQNATAGASGSGFSLSEDPKEVAERLRYADDAVELYRDPAAGVDEVRFVLEGLALQLERIDEGKPDQDEDYQHSESKRVAMSDRAHLFEVVREQAEEQGVSYDDDEVRDPTA